MSIVAHCASKLQVPMSASAAQDEGGEGTRWSMMTYYAIAYQPMSFKAWYSSVMTGVRVATQLVSLGEALVRRLANGSVLGLYHARSR
jgi:hypothetical protein